MIKGYYPALLLLFGMTTERVLMKTIFKDLTSDEALETLNTSLKLIDLIEEDPSFFTKKNKIEESKKNLLEIKTQIENILSKFKYYTIRGREKEYFVNRVRECQSLVGELINNNLFSTLSNDAMSKLFPEGLLEKCQKYEVDDLLDGIRCTELGYPTPAAMILFRVAESVSRGYYEVITGKSGKKKKWSSIIRELGEIKTVPKPLLGYIDFIRSKRNEVNHPDRRVSQDEAEIVLQQLSSILKEMYK